MGTSFTSIQVTGVKDVDSLRRWLEDHERFAIVSVEPDHDYYTVLDDCFHSDEEQIELARGLGAAFGQAVLISAWDSCYLTIAAFNGLGSARFTREENHVEVVGDWAIFGVPDLKKFANAKFGVDEVAEHVAVSLGIENLDRIWFDYECWEEAFDDVEVFETGVETTSDVESAEPADGADP